MLFRVERWGRDEEFDAVGMNGGNVNGAVFVMLVMMGMLV